VVISNCVLNLVPDKQKAFAETHRILKRGAHFSISDIVTSGDLPKGLKEDAEMYAGCVSGAIPREEYFEIVKGAGFENLKVQKEKEINIPDEILAKHLSASDLNESRNSEVGIYSITLYAEKPV
jgi:ubiquinone/menaquinone biosynthesis C-methylase UbiE